MDITIAENCLWGVLGHRIADDLIPRYLNSIPDPAGLKTKCGPSEWVVCSARRVRQAFTSTITLKVLVNVGIAGFHWSKSSTNSSILQEPPPKKHLDPQIAHHKRVLDFDHKLHPNFIVVCIV